MVLGVVSPCGPLSAFLLVVGASGLCTPGPVRLGGVHRLPALFLRRGFRQAAPAQAEWYEAFISAIKAGIAKLKKYFPRKLTYERLKRLQLYVFAIFLDPQYKTIQFQSGSILHFTERTEQEVCRLIKEKYQLVQDEMNINNANSPAENIYDESNDEDEFYIQPNEEEEYKAYLHKPVANKKKSAAYIFLVLSLMARRYLAIPATSALVERVFSIGRNIVTESQNRLDPKTVKKTVLVKSWKIQKLKELEDNFQSSAIIEEEENE